MEILKQFIDNCIHGDSRILIIEIFNHITKEKIFEYYEKYFEKLKKNIDDLYTEKLESKTCKCQKITNFYLGYKLGEGSTWLL